MRRLLLMAVLAPVLSLPGLVSGPADAACAEPGPLARDLRQLPAMVFTGKVTGIETTGRTTAYAVTVTRVYRGTKVVRHETVYAPRRAAACGLQGVQAGETWLFLSNSEPARIETDRLDGTRALTRDVRKTVEEVLGAGTRPLPDKTTTPPATATLTKVAKDDAEHFWPLSAPGFLLLLGGLVVLAAARSLGRRQEAKAHAEAMNSEARPGA